MKRLAFSLSGCLNTGLGLNRLAWTEGRSNRAGTFRFGPIPRAEKDKRKNRAINPD